MYLNEIRRNLEQFCHRVSRAEISCQTGETRDGLYLEVKSADSQYCPFRIEVFDNGFDLEVDNYFVVGDVSPENFGYLNVINSIANGKVSVIETARFLTFVTYRAEIEIEGEESLTLRGKWTRQKLIERGNFLPYAQS